MSTKMKLNHIDSYRYDDCYGVTDDDRAAIHKASRMKEDGPVTMSFPWLIDKEEDADIGADIWWMILTAIVGLSLIGSTTTTIVMACIGEPWVIIPAIITLVLAIPNIRATRNYIFLNHEVDVNRYRSYNTIKLVTEEYGNKDVEIEYNRLTQALDAYTKYSKYGDKASDEAVKYVKKTTDELYDKLHDEPEDGVTEDDAIKMIRMVNGEAT